MGCHSFGIERCEVEYRAQNGDRERKADARCLKFEVDAADYEHDADRLQGGVGEESHEPVEPGGLVFVQFVVPDAGQGEQLLHRGGFPFAESPCDGFVGGHGNDLRVVHESGNLHRGVHHGFGYLRVAPPSPYRVAPFDRSGLPVGLGGGPHHGAHEALVFVGHHLAALVDYRGRTDARPGAHVDAVGGQGDQRSGAGRLVVHEGDGGGGVVQQHGADRVGRVEQAAVGVHVDYDAGGF